MAVDHRPFIERNAAVVVRAAVLGIVGLGLFGGGVGAWLAVRYTTPQAGPHPEH